MGKDETGICIYIDKHLYKKFHLQVIKDDTSIKGVITDFIKEYINDESTDVSKEDEVKEE